MFTSFGKTFLQTGFLSKKSAPLKKVSFQSSPVIKRWSSALSTCNNKLLQSFLLHSTRRTFRSSNVNLLKQPVRRSLGPPIEPVQASPSRLKTLFKPFCFTIFVSGASFAGASIWQYETIRYRTKTPHRFTFRDNRDEFFGKAGHWRQKVNIWWNDLLPGEKAGCCIIGINVAVFLLWKIPLLQPVMVRYFTSSPFSGAPCRSMLFSSFSQKNTFHLLANMYVLWSFTPVISQILGREQFVATYITAAMVSGFASHAFKALKMTMVPSLGASGAIMAILGITCISYPDSQLSLAFVDRLIPHSFSADTAMKALILFDSLGILLRWQIFDHAAHLGGMLFGIWYVKYGHKMIWHKREPVMKYWHNLRGKP